MCRLKKAIAELEEKLDVESTTVDMLEQLVNQLNEDQVKMQQKMKIDYGVKIEKLNDLMKRKDKRLRILEENQQKITKKNDNLYEIINSKNEEALSMTEELRDKIKVQDMSNNRNCLKLRLTSKTSQMCR